jgi:hypothetical protein
MKIAARHGDLLIVKVDTIPAGLKLTNNVLAYGETTGHKHRLTGQVEVFDNTDHRLMGTVPTKYFQALEPQELVHEEHKPIHIEEGMYAVIHEREFDFFEQEIRRVRD